MEAREWYHLRTCCCFTPWILLLLKKNSKRRKRRRRKRSRRGKERAHHADESLLPILLVAETIWTPELLPLWQEHSIHSSRGCQRLGWSSKDFKYCLQTITFIKLGYLCLSKLMEILAVLQGKDS